MDPMSLRSHLADQYQLFHAAVAGADPAARVPTCPDWSVDDLTDHLAHVYRHKVECMRTGVMPEDWPPAWDEDSKVARLESSWAALSAEFEARSPGDHAATWCEPDQTVGFWIRRMAHETVIHRVDAELGAGRPVSPIADDLGADTVAEFLGVMLAWASDAWGEEFTPVLADAGGRPLRIEATGGPVWTLTMRPSGISVVQGDDAAAGATVRGPAGALARWLWNRPAPEITIEGDSALVDRLRGCIAVAGA